MKEKFNKIFSVAFAAVILSTLFAIFSFAADDGWKYADSLPSGITSDKYIIEYNNIYKQVSKTAPSGNGWVNKGVSYSSYENLGEPYTSVFPLQTSETRVLVSYWYYHYCSHSNGIAVNFAMDNTYTHYDGIDPGNFYEAASYADEDDARYTSYSLKYYDGSHVYCRSGFSCDGSWGTHGNRSYLWYKMYRYQDRVKVYYYNFEKQSGWTNKKDASAQSFKVRYKPNHVHSYGSWTVSKKATPTENGTQYRICNGCKQKQTKQIAKLSSIKLSKTSYGYNSKVKTPTVTVKDSSEKKIDSKYYTVTYSKGRKSIGTYSVSVKFKGSYYSGTKKLSFKIVPATVKDLKVTPSKNSVSLKWSKVSNCDKYYIYSYNTKTKKLDFLKETTKNSYKFSSLKSSVKYSYVVRAIKTVKKTKYYSADSSVVATQPYGKPSTVKGLDVAAKNSKSITLKWSSASGNKVKYVVYSYNASKNTYTKLGSTSSKTYTIKNLKPKTNYRYAVCAYSNAGGGYYGNKSDVLTVKTNSPITSPNITSMSLSTEKKLFNVLVKWSAQSGASGYEIYRSTTGKSDSYTKIKTLSASATSFRDTSVAPSKKYYYKVRSYKTASGETAYGKYSDVKTVVTYSAWTENLSVSNFTYSFTNSNDGFSYPSNYRIPFYSYTLIYGNTQIAQYIYQEYDEIWGGNCYGMDAASAMMNVRSSGVKVQSFNENATKISDLKATDKGSLGIDLRTFIEAMQVSQYANYIWDYRQDSYNDYNGLLASVKKVQYSGKPVILCIYHGPDTQHMSGHALLAYDSVKVSATQTNIKVYDPNYSGAERYVKLFTNEQGKVTGWEYEMWENEIFGTKYPVSYLEFVEYDNYSYMWKNRGKVSSVLKNSNALFSNSKTISVFDEDGLLVANIEDGVVTNENSEAQVVRDLSNSNGLMIYLPADETYTVVNNDSEVESFETSMVNVESSASVITQSASVSFKVSDSESVNEASVTAEKGEEYSICLESSNKNEVPTIEVNGSGNGDTAVASQIDGETKLENCKNSKVKVGDVKLSKREIAKLED